MNLKNQFLSAVIALGALSSCNLKDKEKPPVFIEPQLLDSIFNSAYEGIIPCPDCPGIETKIRIFNDSTISRTIYYQGKNELPQTKMGTWSLKDSIFQASFDREKLFYKIKSGNIILRVGSDLKEVEGKLATDYILNRAEDFELEAYLGDYILGDVANNYNKMQLSTNKKKQILIQLSSFVENDTLPKCNTLLKGKLNKENVVEVNLGNEKDSIKHLLKILFTKKESHLFFENTPNDSIPLKCNESLNINYRGTYIKN